MCISGSCKKVGCDYIIDSDAIEDQCGICKGDGTQCKIVEETYYDAPGHGYVKVATIMKGSRNVYFDELKPSDNTIAVSAADEKKFYLNGDFTEQQDGVHDVGGVEGIYNHPEPNKESLVIYGPLKEDIVLFVVYYANENAGYVYRFSEPSSQNYQPRYHWEFVEFGDCPVRCGGGVLIGEPDCLEETAGKVSPSFCQGLEKPPAITRKCNEQPCKVKWRVGKWGMCTACKFQSGVRIREVECVRESEKPGEEDTLLEDDKCPPPKPGTRELCNSHKKCSKNRRDIDGFTPDVLKHLWLQSTNEYMFQEPLSYSESMSNPKKLRRIRRGIIKAKRLQRDCSNSKTVSNSNATHKVGSLVKDRVLPQDIKLIEVPLVQSQLSLNLTDASYEAMGDKISDTLDVTKEKVFTGKEAAARLKEIQHKNNTKLD
ncbi:A disintegrin and metalloproteinase with thrombospondin motifs 7-like [Photinus pyralis]|uniref:A disintegrin and metalloproteinase with thrombospondin motifs 7-like n=1 Tax=Photinus pyralis TaxID=7054 RepID=UPI0012676CB5|nr:A disintegrin and metalloproteinase with thrombospondin motifs 7-like [Photinus pyralis]